MKTLLRTSTALAAITIILYFVSPATAQSTTSKLVIKKKEVYIVGSDNILRVDTLIMYDQASIQFDPGKHGVLEAKVAIIGDKCVISSKGKDGKRGTELAHGIAELPPGEDGKNGGNLSIALNFEMLGKLTIDTRGGNGGPGINGINGKTSSPDRKHTQTYKDINGKQQTFTVTIPGIGTNGSDATKGGSGGDGGNLILMYSTNGFIPVFNHSQHDTNSIIILCTGGQKGRNGVPGKGGRQAQGGILREEESSHKLTRDGQLDLINLNSIAY